MNYISKKIFLETLKVRISKFFYLIIDYFHLEKRFFQSIIQSNIIIIININREEVQKLYRPPISDKYATDKKIIVLTTFLNIQTYLKNTFLDTFN